MDQEYESYSGIFFSPFIFICWLDVVIFLIAAQWKVYTKAGQPGWACIIPIYNIYILTKITAKPGIWTLLVSDSINQYCVCYLAYQYIVKKFRKG